MLTHNPKVKKEVRHLADCASDTVRQLRHAARDTSGAAREAASPVVDEVRGLISALEHTIEVLAREGSSEAAQASRRLQTRARMLADQAREATMQSAGRARERVDQAVVGVQHRVAESPFRAIAIAAAVGAIAALLLVGGSSRRRSEDGQYDGD
ncbi:hypothetical protein NDR89_25995 [Cupriavidus gilardii]|uniref:DUF883 domain-containing protein n=1 Tax=Cupriavidus gilardii TaxID=82541 RepID=A0ABY4VSP3_9BURK|nr:hypothetical protein [Cupriavidus gilardii]USE80013.1 hypothetical protein NDR89_25995 [Cupriavidus gilardii]